MAIVLVVLGKVSVSDPLLVNNEGHVCNDHVALPILINMLKPVHDSTVVRYRRWQDVGEKELKMAVTNALTPFSEVFH